MDESLKMVILWLLDMPSVAMAGLHGYVVLFAVHLMFRRRWPSASGRKRGVMLTVVSVAFCLLLTVLVTLLTVCRTKEDMWGVVVPQWMTLGYSAVIWITLGLLMLKYEGQAVRILWRYRRRNQWSVTDGDEEAKNASQKLPVLSISCLKNLAVCSTLLAELLMLRGALCAVEATTKTTQPVQVNSWQSVALYYFGWEFASVVVVLRMLDQTPIAVHYPMLVDEKVPTHSNKTPTAPPIEECDIQVQFQLPSVRNLVTDYVVPSNVSLLSARRRGMDHESTVEHRYCEMHCGGAAAEGTEYVNCHCCRERDDKFLSNANVPLLSEEYEPVTNGLLAYNHIVSVSPDAETSSSVMNENIKRSAASTS
ncbi:unnamed protein product [Phytophthora lilii]|uniref:Unnamed protein product n=1 Tax=Phytophthora lilii TaxID=2077276 RepID=A0A9W6TJE2_9STRA|nr:unnamed protein product [Phytophthora lilii]